MAILDIIETYGTHGLTALQHAAAWLVGAVATGQENLTALQASDPLVKAAVAAGVAAAQSHGVPVGDIEHMGADVLAAAKDLAAGLGQTAAPKP